MIVKIKTYRADGEHRRTFYHVYSLSFVETDMIIESLDGDVRLNRFDNVIESVREEVVNFYCPLDLTGLQCEDSFKRAEDM